MPGRARLPAAMAAPEPPGLQAAEAGLRPGERGSGPVRPLRALSVLSPRVRGAKGRLMSES